MKARSDALSGRSSRSVEASVQGKARPGWLGALRQFCRRVMREIGAAEWDLSILLCDDARMRKLNGRYRGKDNTTDVLSFPREEHHRRSAASLEGSVVAGDIAISMDTLRRNAFALSVTEEEELKRLLIHGILHCAGMDHGTGKGKGMLALQERLLGELHQVRIIRK